MTLDNNMDDDEYDLLDEAAQFLCLLIVGMALAIVGGIALGIGSAALDGLLTWSLDSLIREVFAWLL